MKKIVSLLLACALIFAMPLPIAVSGSAAGSGAPPGAETADDPISRETMDLPETDDSAAETGDVPCEDSPDTPAQDTPDRPTGENETADSPSEPPEIETAGQPTENEQTDETDDTGEAPTGESPDEPPEPPSETPEMPETSDLPQTPDVPETGDSPETSDIPRPYESPDTPEPPDEHQSPDEPDIPDETEPRTPDDPIPDVPVDPTPMGDVNGDMVVNSEDALLLLRAAVGFPSISGRYMKYADIDGDSVITSADAFIALRIAVADVISAAEHEKTQKSDSSEPQPSPQKADTAPENDFSTWKKGIDVSAWQGNIDFKKVKAAGVDFVIIRAGLGRELSQKDPYFEQNYARAKAAGLDVGVYWYSYAESAQDAINEAWACMAAIEGKKFEYPIYFDLEEQWQLNLGMNFCSSLVASFCYELEKYGYHSGFYMSTSPAKKVISYEIQSRYAYWAAEWGPAVNYYNQYGIWQYGTEIINGVNGAVDVDISYIDYPSVMKAFHLNGY